MSGKHTKTWNRRPLLTDDQVLTCRQAVAAGQSITQLAHDLGVGTWVVKLAVAGRTYRHLPGAVPRTRKNVARGSDSPHAKLDEQRVRDIRAAVARGETQRALAQRYGVSYSTVLNAVQGRTWRHLAPAETTIEPPSAGRGRRQSAPEPPPEHSCSERTLL